MQRTVANKMSEFTKLGEATNISFDFLGKAIIVPAVIMAASKEPKEKKKYSAFKNTVAAFIQLALEVPILYAGSMYVAKLANSGKLDKAGSRFSYNEKLAGDIFAKAVKENAENPDAFTDLLERLNAKGFGKKLGDELGKLVSNCDSKSIKSSFKKLKTTNQRLYHLQNRACFAAAILLTPAICALEDWLHPKVMSKFFDGKNKTFARINVKTHSMKNFLNKTRTGAVSGLK